MTDLPSDRLASPEPKCANCKWMAAIGNRINERSSWSAWFVPSPPPDFDRIPGKGACQEPCAGAAYPTLFYVTDLMLCSRWERKE